MSKRQEETAIRGSLWQERVIPWILELEPSLKAWTVSTEMGTDSSASCLSQRRDAETMSSGSEFPSVSRWTPPVELILLGSNFSQDGPRRESVRSMEKMFIKGCAAAWAMGALDKKYGKTDSKKADTYVILRFTDGN